MLGSFVVDVTFGSESVSCTTDTVLSWFAGFVVSNLGEQVVELASPFSTAGMIMCEGGLAEETMVQVETVLVEAVVDKLGRAVDVVVPVDFKVGVTVADGLVKAAGLPSLSTRGLIGTVQEVAAVPALLGRGRGRLVSCLLEEKSSVGLIGKSNPLTWPGIVIAGEG